MSINKPVFGLVVPKIPVSIFKSYRQDLEFV